MWKGGISHHKVKYNHLQEKTTNKQRKKKQQQQNPNPSTDNPLVNSCGSVSRGEHIHITHPHPLMFPVQQVCKVKTDLGDEKKD